MRYACDACRLRKVRCTATQITGEAAARPSCEFCLSIGIPCRITRRQRQRAKPGRKGNDRPVETLPSRSSAKRRRKESSAAITLLKQPLQNHVKADRAVPTSSRTTPSASAVRLFGVQGLDRDALDSCIEAFFTTIGNVFRLFDSQQVFLRRVRVQLYYSAGLDIPADLIDIAGNPASRLLILAVACRGSPFSPHPELEKDLYAHCCSLLSRDDALRGDYLDAIEAILLLSELTIQPRHLSPTTLDPLGKGTAVDIALHFGLNVPPPATSPDFERRRGVFMRVWTHDAIRSASAHTSHRITDEDIGWPMPSSPDKYPYICLTLATRQLADALLSPRVVGLGATEADVRASLQATKDYRDMTKVNLVTLCSAVRGSSGEDAPRNGATVLLPIEQLFLLSSFNWLHLVMWVAVQDAVDRHPGSLSPGLVSEVHEAVTAACEEASTLARLSTAHNLHATGPKSIRNHMAAFSLFLVRTFTATPAPSGDELMRSFAMAEALNAGVGAACFYSDSETLAETMRVALYRASRVELKDATRMAERGLDALPPDESATHLFHTLTAVATGSADVQMGPLSENADLGPTSDVDLESGKEMLNQTLSLQRSSSGSYSALDSASLWSRTATSQGTVNSSTHLGAAGDNPPFRSATTGEHNSAVTDESPQTPESIDWSELMDTLRDCGFEMPMGSLNI